MTLAHFKLILLDFSESGFHPHPNEPPLFEEGSHVQLDEDADVIVADLR